MASTVRSLSNHYDILRVPAAATGDEIVEAFAAEMRAARLRPDIPVARLAQLSVAYETLRDPVKRRAYDASLGLNRAPKPEPPRVLAPAESRVASFIASSLRDPAKPAETQAAPDPVPEPTPAPAPETIAQAAPVAAPEAAPSTPEGLLIDRNRATIGAGAVGLAILALAVSTLAKTPDALTAPPQAAQAVTVGLPPAAPVQDYVVPPEATLTRADQAAPKGEAQPAPAAAPEKVEEAPASPPAAEVAAAEKPSDPLAALPQQASAAADESAPVAVADATLPLPKATIARTIERIGYPCGSVASAAAVDASAGTFKITCASGDSYRAAPVGGRYHFRRWDRP